MSKKSSPVRRVCYWYMGLTCSPLWLKEIQSSSSLNGWWTLGFRGLQREIFVRFAQYLDRKERKKRNYLLAVCLVGIRDYDGLTGPTTAPFQSGTPID